MLHDIVKNIAQNVTVITTKTEKNITTVAGDISGTAAAKMQSRAKMLSPSPLVTIHDDGLDEIDYANLGQTRIGNEFQLSWVSNVLDRSKSKLEILLNAIR